MHHFQLSTPRVHARVQLRWSRNAIAHTKLSSRHRNRSHTNLICAEQQQLAPTAAAAAVAIDWIGMQYRCMAVPIARSRVQQMRRTRKTKILRGAAPTGIEKGKMQPDECLAEEHAGALQPHWVSVCAACTDYGLCEVQRIIMTPDTINEINCD